MVRLSLILMATRQSSGMTQGFPTGELWGLNSQPFCTRTDALFLKMNHKYFDYIGMISVEKLFVRTWKTTSGLPLKSINSALLSSLEAGGTGLLGVLAAVPSVEIPGGEFVGPFRSPSFEKRYVLEDVHPHQISDVLRQFFDEFYDLAACSRSAVLSDAHVVSEQIAASNADLTAFAKGRGFARRGAPLLSFSQPCRSFRRVVFFNSKGLISC